MLIRGRDLRPVSLSFEDDAASGALDRIYEKLTGAEAQKDLRPLDHLLNDPKLS